MSVLGIPNTRQLCASATTLRLCASRLGAPRLATGFHRSSIRRALSEADRHRDNMEAEIEKQRNESLQNHKDGRPRWRETLATVSEAGVKADRNEMADSAEAAAMERAIKREAKQKGEVPETETADKGTKMEM